MGPLMSDNSSDTIRAVRVKFPLSTVRILSLISSPWQPKPAHLCVPPGCLMVKNAPWTVISPAAVRWFLSQTCRSFQMSSNAT